MARNNSSASAPGTARSAPAGLKSRAVSSTATAFQLFLRQRRRALRNSATSETDPKSPFSKKSLGPSASQYFLSNDLLSSLPRRVKHSDITASLALHRNLTNPAAVDKLAKLYKRHRNLQRALALFLLRRQQWRRSRKPTFRMDFIANLRRIQADEPSSDEESGLIPTSATTRVPRRPSPAPSTTTATTSEQPGETSITGTKRKRDAAAVAVAPLAEVTGESSRAAKKAKVEPPPPAVTGKVDKAAPNGKPSEPQPEPEPEPAAPNMLTPSNKGAPAKKAATPSKPAAAPPAPAPTAAPASPPVPPNKKRAPDVARMELFERRVHEMLTDPLGFDDFVHDSARPVARHVARSFARYRHRQTQPPPPLVMSGALGPMPVGVGKKSGKQGNGGQQGSLAREAQKRAHRMGVQDRVKGGDKGIGKGKGKAPEMNGTGKGVLGDAKQAGVVNGKVGKRTKERAWLTNARQKPGVQQNGQYGQGGVKKYTR